MSSMKAERDNKLSMHLELELRLTGGRQGDKVSVNGLSACHSHSHRNYHE